MLRLESVDILEFKKKIYPEYLKLFPENERKSLKIIEKLFNDNILKIIEIIDKDIFVGFMIINCINTCKYLQLDYFAILNKFQNKGYGTKAIQLLKEKFKEYKGIFIEVDKIGMGDTKEENELRVRRVEFYERLGFCKLKFDLNLFDVIFSSYVLPIFGKKEDDKKILEDIFKIYNKTFGEKRAKQKCKVLFSGKKLKGAVKKVHKK